MKLLDNDATNSSSCIKQLAWFLSTKLLYCVPLRPLLLLPGSFHRLPRLSDPLQLQPSCIQTQRKDNLVQREQRLADAEACSFHAVKRVLEAEGSRREAPG